MKYDYHNIITGIFCELGIQYTPDMIVSGIEALKEGLSLYRKDIDERKLDKFAKKVVSEFKESGFDWATGESYLTYDDKVKLVKEGFYKAVK